MSAVIHAAVSMLVVILVAFILIESTNPPDNNTIVVKDDVLVITVATEANDGFHRFISSVTKHGYGVKVLGMGQKWEGGDVARNPGGGQKIRLLREAMEEFKNNEYLLIVFVDSYDVVFQGGPEDMLNRFLSFNAKLVFSAESFCWPDKSLAEFYPTVKVHEKRYLNSGGFVGYAPQIYNLLEKDAAKIKDTDDDQHFYSKVFLNTLRREELKIELDTRSQIFQNLNGALDEVSIKFEVGRSYLVNTKMDGSSHPLVVHGNGPIKVEFNGLTNYIPDQWTPTEGCLVCLQDVISLDDVKVENYPFVLMAIFLERPTAFLEDFFINIASLTYPKEKIDLFIHNVDALNAKDVEKFTKSFGTFYRSIQTYDHVVPKSETAARKLAIAQSVALGSDYFFSIDGDVQLENVETLQLLIERNRSVIAPLLVRPGKLWSNFWGALNGEGFYKRSDDYVDIIQLKKLGLWNVPYMSGAYLVQKRHLAAMTTINFGETDLDSDIAVCKHLREKMVFMYVDNEVYYGHLVDSEHIEKTRLHADLYMLFDNRYTWEKKYIHTEYNKTLYETPLSDIFRDLQPCTDVFWLPIISPTFCRDLIEEMENYGQWSGGGDKAQTPVKDTRLTGGYENVPTVDIHMNQIGFERHWLHFLKEFVAPLSAKMYEGFYTESRAIMNFVVRYKPGEQDRLRPHSDSSTYTINIALNDPETDYEGGGTRFIRYNCSHTQSRTGWMLMHPGRVTHQHEGLPTTKGTRYIMISFIDP